MRMSRRMGLIASLGMNPDSVTVNGGKLQYWASASETEDKWHNVTSTYTGETNYVPYSNDVAYAGRNDSSKSYHNAALAFKTGSFTGRGNHIAISFNIQPYGYGAGFAYAAQLSRHDWSTEEAWFDGSKTYYSKSMTALPDDPNAIASKTGTIPYKTNSQTVKISLDAKILPDTEYVLYLIGTSGVAGHLITINKTSSNPMTITVTE